MIEGSQASPEEIWMEHEVASEERVAYAAYQELSSALKEYYTEIDAEIVLVTLSLFIVTLLILSPRGSFRGLSLQRRRYNREGQTYYWPEHHHDGEGEEGVSSTRTTTTNSTYGAEEEETEEEKFEQLWPAIWASGYRRLVLPPECKLVDVPAFMKRQKEEQRKEKKFKKRDTEIDDDHPLTRLKSYADQLLHLLRNFLSYNYTNAGWMFINWLQYWLRLKQRKPHEVEQIVEEEKDDDDTVALTPLIKRDETIELLSEEKEEKLIRRTSESSAYQSVFDDDDDEHDIGPCPLSPLSSPTGLRSSGKKKDALGTYRSSTKSPGHFPSTPPTSSLKTPESPEMKTPFEEEDKFQTPTRARKFSARKLPGSMAFFDAAHSKESLRRLSIAVPVPDRNGYILGDDFLPNNRHTPLLVFVNSRSGPQQGHLLVGQLRRLLNPIQVWDLADGSPERVLESFSVLSRLRILVCGGDGTVSWIISCLEKMHLERWPPIAILPLGTGNDLARIHGWGGGYNNESLLAILEQVSQAYISLLDRWEMKIEDEKGQVKTTKSFFNYVGVGADAQAALQVHMLRESTPHLFFSRVVNKMWYLVFGTEDAIKESNINLSREITLIADGVEVPLPPDSQGIILLNVDSFSGGVPMWSHGVKEDVDDDNSMDGSSESPLGLAGLMDAIAVRRVRSMGHFPTENLKPQHFAREDSIDDIQPLTEENKCSQIFACDRPSSCQDGALDIVSVRGTFHLGQIRVGLSNASRLCQASEVKIILKKKAAVQIDGEPWRQSACTMTITRKKEPAVMLHRSADESGGVETEMAKLLDWAEDRKIIDRNVHDVLMKEFSRRIENKTRQRRVKSQDNLMLSLKRAMLSGGATTQQNAFPGTLSF